MSGLGRRLRSATTEAPKEGRTWKTVTRRYEWSEPGALLHMDAKKLPVFSDPGHWVDGNRFRQQRRPVGSQRIEFAHCVVDDHTRSPTSSCTHSIAATSPPRFSSAPRLVCRTRLRTGPGGHD
jgi:hypothetical protein